MKKIVVLIAMIAFSCIGDDNSDDVNCTLEAKAGLVVTIKDAATGLELQEGVSLRQRTGLIMRFCNTDKPAHRLLSELGKEPAIIF